MNFVFILNPAAGKNKTALNMIPDIQKTCDKAGLKYQIHISKSGEDITRFVKMLCENNRMKASVKVIQYILGIVILTFMISGCNLSKSNDLGGYPNIHLEEAV